MGTGTSARRFCGNQRIALFFAVVLALFAYGCRDVSQETLPSPHRPIPDPNAALLTAIRERAGTDQIASLLRAGANPDSVERETHDEKTALSLAARQGRFEIAKLLLDSGAKPNLREGASFDGVTPLMAAVAGRNLRVVELLIDSGASVNARTGINGTGLGALSWAVISNQRGAVTQLLAAGADVHHRDVEVAISQGEPDILELLLAAGFDPRATLATGRTVFQEAEAARSKKAELKAVVKAFLGANR